MFGEYFGQFSLEIIVSVHCHRFDELKKKELPQNDIKIWKFIILNSLLDFKLTLSYDIPRQGAGCLQWIF